MQLYDPDGQRMYLTPTERDDFLMAAEDAVREVRTFCAMLAYTGCRISEALALTADRIDVKAGAVVFENLKERRSGVYRPVPVPPAFLGTLKMVHDIRSAQKRKDRGRGVVLWDWSRGTALSRVCEVMDVAGISGPHATPKGLRHGSGIKAVTSGVPLNLLQMWLGHAALSTTAIYADATAPEAKQLAERMWA
jgi:integrase/recombinase XerD